MGYETRLIFVSDWEKKFKGFGSAEATLEMGCISYGFIAELIKKLRSNNKLIRPINKKIDRFEELQKKVYGDDGNYPEDFKSLDRKEQRKLEKEHWQLEKELGKKLLYIYDGRKQAFRDAYGDLLLVVSLDELKEALIKDDARLIHEEKYDKGYRRFKLALEMIQHFQNPDYWNKNEIKIVMWGH